MVPESDVVLVVDGAVDHNLKLSFADLARFPRHSLRATDELGKESLFEGVLVAEILKSVGVKFGKELTSWQEARRLSVGRDRRRLPRRLRSTGV
jgi:DMSO/TMAO reductase YedYZ molybdopterin-dependent catalytic subunit